MAKGVSISVKGVDAIRKKFKGIPENIATAFDAKLGTIAQRFVNDAVSMAPVDLGDLKNGITHENPSPMKWVISSRAPYSGYVEFGTKKRFKAPATLTEYAAQFKGKSGFGSIEDFRKQILAWVKRKGIRFDSAGTVKSGKNKGKAKQLTYEQTGYVIFHFILLHGINPHAFFFPQLPIAEEAIKAELPQMVKEALK